MTIVSIQKCLLAVLENERKAGGCLQLLDEEDINRIIKNFLLEVEKEIGD